MEKNKKTFLIAMAMVFVVLGLVIAKKKKTQPPMAQTIVKPRIEATDPKALERKGQDRIQETRIFKWSEAKPDVKIAPPTPKELQRAGSSSGEAPKRYIDPEIKKKILSQRKVFE